MPSIQTASIPVTSFPNEFVSPWGNDEVIPLYSSVPLKTPVVGCLPCVVCGNSSVRDQIVANAGGLGGAGFGVNGRGRDGFGGSGGKATITLTPPTPGFRNLFDNGSIISIGLGVGYPWNNTTYETTVSHCELSVGTTLRNTTEYAATINIVGGVNDDVLFNGVIYQAGQFPFNWNDFNNPCGSTNADNGAHNFNYTKTLSAGEDLLIQVLDRGYGGGLTFTATIL